MNQDQPTLLNLGRRRPFMCEWPNQCLPSTMLQRCDPIIAKHIKPDSIVRAKNHSGNQQQHVYARSRSRGNSSPCGQFRGRGHRSALAAAKPTLEALHVQINYRRDVQRQELRNDQSADHRQAQRLARVGAFALFAAVTLQVALGIVTLLWRVPLPLALLHQAMAMLVLTAAALHAAGLRLRASIPLIPAQPANPWP